ncbi:hypothetical protein BZG35_14300 [Brevundimonas sp. LM2]|uniref:putative bifunctional diguanylate cyclase/phosphodiesterase n=1 Tax=Brevundimonas sp. LM2 TaxID=1938605 RepID=UPI000983D797|nr:EAL domain-containing protein [Brevundimonas sp. LM2]AQR62686.1 hypothetical protein BZG35_14300 [Brevundimonas sp. LM2]
MPQRARAKNEVWKVAGGGLLAIVLLGVTLTRMSDSFDRVSREREQVLVDNGLASRVAEIGRGVVPQAVWDEAVVHLDNRFDRGWARDNIGTYLHVTDGFQFSWVLNAEDRPLYGMDGGRDAPLSAYKNLERPMAGLVARVRQAEALRITTTTPSQANKPMTALTASAIDRVGEDLFVLSATLVQPDFGTARIQGRRAPVVVTGHRVDQAFIDAFAARYMLTDAHLHLDDARDEPGEAHASIADPRGTVVATVDWTPQRPGGALLARFLPLTLALLSAILIVALAAYRRAYAATVAVIESEQRAVHIAYHDTLTGLGNRAALEARLAELVEVEATDGPRYALHCIDLDNFKDINDISGHSLGDELLRFAARRLRRMADAEAVCYRIGGDEFALLQPLTDADSAQAWAEAIVQAIARPFALSIGRIQTSASVGVALLSAEDRDAGDVLRRADLALFAAKRQGRSRFAVYDPDMDEALRLRRGMQEALKRDLHTGALTMVYQPQVDRARNLIGVEALVRWTSSTYGAVSPAVFVPLAEECGLIEALGMFTLKRAFRDSLRWPNVKTAINVSALQLRDGGFTARIVALAEAMGVQPSNIELELTEGVLVDQGQETAAQLRALRAAGFSLAIDDFGTGYSSLSYLSRFPIGKIKIDRSFVVEIGLSNCADVLVSTIIDLGRSLNMRVIAEGVETTEQWLRLAAVGCNEFQGYLSSPPVGADLIARMYDGQKVDLPGQDARFAPERRIASAA